jgi:hypothetical protein
MPRLAGSIIVAVVVTVSGASFAQVSATNAALAEKLFEDARQLMAQQKYGEACAKLAESERLDPGVGTLLNLGECYEKSGKVASAWATYREAEGAAAREGQKKRASFAGSRARALAPDLSYLVVETASPPAGLTIRCDGKAIGGTSLGTPMPFDAGTHHVEAQAPGRRPWSTSVELAVKSTIRVAIPDLEVAPEPPDSARVPPVEKSPPPPDPASSSGTAQRVTGVALGVVGLVGVGVGSYFGLRAKDLHDDAESNHCTPVSCTQLGANLTSDARENATLSTVAFSVGAAALAAGVILYLVAPKGKGPRTSRADVPPALWTSF